jgi:hypothetical protein
MVVPPPPARWLGALAAAAGVACGGSRAAPVAASPRADPETVAEFSPADTAGFMRVRFARGTTSGIFDDSLAPGRDRGYLLGALQGQVMLAHAIGWPSRVGGPDPEARVRVYRAHDGVELESPGPDGPLWFGHLPGTGDYVIRVTAPAEGAIAYTLAVQIPQRLVLDRGHPQSEVSARAPSRAPVDFLVKGSGGQRLRVELRGAPAGGAPPTLHLYGLDDGAQLAPLGERRRSWSGALPSDQEYVVSVVPPGQGAQYDLLVALH